MNIVAKENFSIATTKMPIFYIICLTYIVENLILNNFSIACLYQIWIFRAVSKEKQVPYQPAIKTKRAIFLQDMLCKSCSKSHFLQLSHSMSCKNINIYWVYWDLKHEIGY